MLSYSTCFEGTKRAQEGNCTRSVKMMSAAFRPGGAANGKEMMTSIAASSQLCLIMKSRNMLLWTPRLVWPSASPRKTLTCALMTANSLASTSLSKTHKENTLPPVQVDWLSLSDEEFEEASEAISSDFGPDFSRMDYEQFNKFCKRRGEYVSDCSDRLSKLVGSVDLLTPWKRRKNGDVSFIACNDEDIEESELPATKENHDSALKARKSNNS